MLKFIVCTVTVFLSLPSNAYWAGSADAPIVLDRVNSSVEVKADGSYVEEETRQLTAKNETGRNDLALQRLAFLPEIASIQVIKAVSITDGVETPVDLKTLHEGAAAGPKGGIAGVKELVIPFTNLKIGSSIRYTFKTIFKKPLHPGVYFQQFSYGVQMPELGGVVKIRSEKPLTYAVRDREKNLKIEKGQEGSFSTLTITQIKPVQKVLKDEKLPILTQDAYSQVQITTLKNWQEFASVLAEKYEKALIQELPPVFKAIADKAAQKKDIHAMIDTVTSELATIMTYSGNWTTTQKMYFPRGHAEVAASKTGDCKDFSVSTAAILRKLGLRATVALVGRKNPYDAFQVLATTPLDSALAMPTLFNHAIVRIENAGRVFWVDPTNAVSNSRFSNPDIAGSATLNLSKTTTVLEKIPLSEMDDSVLRIEKNVRVQIDEKVETEGTLTASGVFAGDILDTFFRTGLDKAQEVVVSYFGAVLKEPRGKIQSSQFKSRVASEFKAKIKTEGESSFAVRDQKQYFLAPLPRVLEIIFAASSRGRVMDFNAFPRSKILSSIKVEGWDIVDSESHGCYAVSPWFEVERKLLKNQKGFEVRDQISIKQAFITAAEINEEEFGFSLGDLESCFRSMALQITKIESNKTLENRLATYKLSEMKKKLEGGGPKKTGTYVEVKMMADQMLEKNPKDIEAGIFRIRAIKSIGYRRGQMTGPTYLEIAERETDAILKSYADYVPALIQKTYTQVRMRKFDEAKKTFGRAYYAAKERTFDLYELGGYVARSSSMWRVAEGSYLKALALAKTDSEKASVYRSLGNVLDSQGNKAKAESYFYSSLKYEPDNAWLMNDLLLLSMDKKDFEAAIEIGEKMLKISDFGVGRMNLSDAYAGRAQWLLEKNSKDVTIVDQAVEAAMKGMKWHSDSVACMLALGEAYHSMAELKKDPEFAKRSSDISIKALAYAKYGNDRKRAITSVNKANALVTYFRSQNKSGRLPASAGTELSSAGP